VANETVAKDHAYAFGRLKAAAVEYGLGRSLVAQGTPAGMTEGCAALERVGKYWDGLRSQGQLPPDEAADRASLNGWLARCKAGLKRTG
jgi:hypothetical protein